MPPSMGGGGESGKEPVAPSASKQVEQKQLVHVGTEAVPHIQDQARLYSVRAQDGSYPWGRTGVGEWGEAEGNILGGQQWSFGDVGINTSLRSEGDTTDQYMLFYANYSQF